MHMGVMRKLREHRGFPFGLPAFRGDNRW
jgi:hypothetical protein